MTEAAIAGAAVNVAAANTAAAAWCAEVNAAVHTEVPLTTMRSSCDK